MTVQLSSLRVSADLDAAGYTSGAAAKEAADKRMIASGREVGKTVSQTDSRLSVAGNSIERLMRQTVQGYSATQQFERGVRTLSRALEMNTITAERAEQVLVGLHTRYGLTANAGDLMAAGQARLAAIVTKTNATLAVQAAQADQTAAAVTRMGAANDNAARFRMQNMGFQLQDIGVSLYSGMPVSTVLIQQGSQIVGTYAGHGGVNAALKDFMTILGSVARVAGPFIAAGAAIYGAYKLIAANSAEARASIDSTTAALSAQAAPIATVESGINELASLQEKYQRAIKVTADTQNNATASIIANTQREFEAKQALLGLELKRQQAAIAAQKAELTVAGLQMKREVATSVFTNMDLERRGFSDPKIGRFVALPDDVTGLEKTQQVIEGSGINDKLIEMRANLTLTELAAKTLEEALQATFDDGSLVKQNPTRERKTREKLTEFQRDLKSLQDRRVALVAERDAVGMTEAETTRLAVTRQLEAAAMRDAIGLSPDRIKAIREEAAAQATVVAELEKARNAQEYLELARDTFKGFITDLRDGLRQGESFWDAFRNSAVRAMDTVSDKLLGDVMDALFQVKGAASGIGGGGGGGILGWIGGLFGLGRTSFAGDILSGKRVGLFASGTSSAPPGLAWVGERGPELVNFRGGERVYDNVTSMRLASNQNDPFGGQMTRIIVEIAASEDLVATARQEGGAQAQVLIREYGKGSYERHKDNHARAQRRIPGYSGR